MCSVVPGSIGSVATSIVWLAVAPCLAAAWISTAFLRGLHVSFLPDTVAMLAPFPAMAGAVLAAVYDLTETFDACLGCRRQLQQDMGLAGLVVTCGRVLQNLTVILDGP